jgi:CheY-like chemotaxis protein
VSFFDAPEPLYAEVETGSSATEASQRYLVSNQMLISDIEMPEQDGYTRAPTAFARTIWVNASQQWL